MYKDCHSDHYSCDIATYVNSLFFAWMIRYLLTLDTIDILCLVYSNICAYKINKMKIVINANNNRRIQ